MKQMIPSLLIVMLLGLWSLPASAEPVSSYRDPARALKILDEIPQQDITSVFCLNNSLSQDSAARIKACHLGIGLMRERFEDMQKNPELPLFDLQFLRAMNKALTSNAEPLGYEDNYRNQIMDISFGAIIEDKESIRELSFIAREFKQTADRELFIAPSCPSKTWILVNMAWLQLIELQNHDLYQWYSQCWKETNRILDFDDSQNIGYDHNSYSFSRLRDKTKTMPRTPSTESPIPGAYKINGIEGGASLDNAINPLLEAMNLTLESSWDSEQLRDEHLYFLARTLLYLHAFGDGNTRTSTMTLNMLRLAIGLTPWEVRYQPEMRDISSRSAPDHYTQRKRRAERGWLGIFY